MPLGRTSSSGYGSPSPRGSKAPRSSRYSRTARSAAASGLPDPSALVEIGRDELDALGLEDDGVGAAFEVDGAAMGLVGPVVGNDGVGVRTPLGLLLGVGQSASGLGEFALDLPQFAFRDAALRGGVGMVEVQVDARGPQLADPVAQAPGMVLDVAQGEPGIGQLRLRDLRGISSTVRSATAPCRGRSSGRPLARTSWPPPPAPPAHGPPE